MQIKELNEYPQPAMLGGAGRLCGMNELARALFPGFKPGDELPEVLNMPADEPRWEGSVPLMGNTYRVTSLREGEHVLYLISPREQYALTEGQLDGALYQMRTLMGQFRRELGPYVSGEREQFAQGDLEEFSGSYYRMLRLMDHLDLLRDAASGQLFVEKQWLELGRVCERTAMECDGLLKEVGVKVVFESSGVPVPVSGDEGLLRDALLELISNCARRRKQGGQVKLQLSSVGKWARICVTDDGPQATKRERLTLTGRGLRPLIPTPDMGAGLGLSAAEEIIRRHAGALMVSADGGAPRVYLMLPIVRRGGENLPLRSPGPERNAGLNPYLIALSDVLPGAVIREDWKV